jgi:hypothetical protein
MQLFVSKPNHKYFYTYKLIKPKIRKIKFQLKLKKKNLVQPFLKKKQKYKNEIIQPRELRPSRKPIRLIETIHLQFSILVHPFLDNQQSRQIRLKGIQSQTR